MKRISYDDIEMGEVLGTGTVGTVYRGTIRSSGQEVAVKVLQAAISSDPLIRARFRREMAILQRLDHPHIIRYFGGSDHEGQLFFAMELLLGGNVRDLLERFGSLSWQETCSIGRQVCSALQYAHNQGIVHRDLKPGNLFLDSNAIVKLGDFGIARDTGAADITIQGLTVGTHAYMAPEQIIGADNINGQADLYSLGCVLFELITGRKPFTGSNFAVLFEQHLRQPPPRVTELVPDCPGALSDIVNQLLAKEPAARPFNARTVQGVLHELLASDGAKSEGAPIPPKDHANPTGDAKGAVDIGAANVVDPGLKSLVRKLRPDPTPQVSWRVVALLCLLIVAMLAAAMLAR